MKTGSYIETEGIVLKKIKYLESSAMVEIFTPIFGNKNFLVKGVYRKNKRLRSHMEQLSLNHLEIFYKENREINLITKAQIIFYPYNVIKDTEKFFHVMHMVSILRKQRFPTETVSKLYNLLKESLEKFDKGSKFENVYSDFLEEYLTIEGLLNKDLFRLYKEKENEKDRIVYLEKILKYYNL